MGKSKSQSNIFHDALTYYDQIKFASLKDLQTKIPNVEKVSGQLSDLQKRYSHNDSFEPQIFDLDISLFGVYSISKKTFSWSWHLPHIPKYMKRGALQLLFYAHSLDPDIQHNILIHSLLTNSKVVLPDKIERDMFLALITYLCGSQYIYHVISNDEPDIIEIYELNKSPISKTDI